MPGSNYASIQNPRMYRALKRRGFSKEAAARISNARTPGHRVKDSGVASLSVPPTGPDALFNQPGVEGTRAKRRRRRFKALNWGARGGQTIGGALGRGADGRFASSGQPSARQAGSAAQKKRREEMRAKRQARADERIAAREAEAAQEEATRAEEDSYIASGKTGAERQRRRAEIAAKRRARAAERRQRSADATANERELRRQEDEDEARTRETEAATAGGGGGGGGGKQKPTDEQKLAEQEKKAAANRAATAPKVGLSTADTDALKAAAEGATGQTMAQLRTLEVLGLTSDGEATDAGRRALRAMERGDVRGALAAIQDGKAKVARDRTRSEGRRARAEEQKRREQERQAKQRARDEERRRQEEDRTKRDAERQAAQAAADAEAARLRRESSRTTAAQAIRNMSERRQRRRRKETYGGTPRGKLAESVFAGPDRSFPIVTAQDVRDAVRSLGRTKHDKAAVKRGIIRRARAIGAMEALPAGWAKSFTVFKSADGRTRWAAITTTAYEDKDREWISTKAIRTVVAAGDASGVRGPLRFWHVPGLDLGDCDYQAALDGGRLLLESGTFRSPAAARIGQKAAELGYQMSPGFLHTRREPRGGVFDHIAIFERSFVPPGRASNPYTRLLTKESRMLTDEKRKEFEALAGDAEGQALLQSLLAQAQATTKAADAAGAVYKDAPAWAQDLAQRLGALEATVKAPMPPAEMEEAGATEMEDAALDSGLGMGDAEGAAADVLDDEGFADLLVQKLVAALGPMLDLEKKMTGYLGEMKAMLQPAAPPVAKDDTRAQELAALEQRLKALEGDQPRSLNASAWHQLTGTVVTKEQATALTAQAPNAIPAGLSTPEEIGAYQLLFGNE